jgi:hypothetical protein
MKFYTLSSLLVQLELLNYKSSSSTTNNLIITSSVTQTIPSNSNRKYLIIENTTNIRVYLLFGSGVPSTTNYTFSIGQHESQIINYYTGQLNLRTSSATSVIVYSELV